MVGGELVMALAEATGAQLIPVDSEHSALHQLIAAEQARAGTIERLVLTASGGPFRGRTRAELEDVTVEEALRHPTWAMGGKITIDSATLMNKGLEVIEAHHLFGTPYERIDVVVHPQSIVHALVTLCDGAALAHLGPPRHARADLLRAAPPRARRRAVRTLDLAEVGALTFEPPDDAAFPCLRLAREAAVAGGTGAVRAERRQRGRRARLPQRPARLHGHPRGDRAHARAASARAACTASTRCTRRTRGRARWPASSSRRCTHELPPRVPRLRRADHPARGRALRGRQGGRHARRALLAVLPAAGRPPQARRDRVRDRGDPARRLREDHGHEPGGGHPAGGRAPGLLPAAGVEADRGDRRRAGREHRARVPDPVGPVLWPPARGSRVDRVERGHRRAGARRAGAGRPDRVGRRRARRLRAPAGADRHATAARASRVDGCAAATPATIVVVRDGRSARCG